METDIAEGGHTLIIGPMECILEMNRRLEPHKEKGSFLPFEKLAELVSEYPVIFGAGHPYREGGHIPESEQGTRTGKGDIFRNCRRRCWRNSSSST